MTGLSQPIGTLNQGLGQLEALPQAVVAYGRDLSKGEVLPFHQHRRAQLVFASSGVMAVTTAAASYVVPPQRAVWMPSGIRHRIEARGAVAMRTLYIKESEISGLPVEVCVLQIAPLLRELILNAVASGPSYEPGSAPSRVAAVILDQICTQAVVSLGLSMPTDPRLLRVARALIENPADPRNLSMWARDVGASARTLSRLFPIETGMSFQIWRQQLKLLQALEMLASGSSVNTVALELGYDNTSAFIAMFRRYLGTTPARYLNISGT